MLKVYSGRFHPELEQAFLKRVLELKNNPMARVAVVAPSGRLVERLQRAIAAKGTFLNIHFHTFSSLAENIVDVDGPLDKAVRNDPLFFDTLVKHIVREDRPFEEFAETAVPQGFPPAVRGTLRDLLDAGINQDNVEAAIQEEFVGKDVDLGSLRSLLNLHRLYLRRISKLKVIPRSALLSRAIELAPDSSYLKGFEETLIYGFYDLTGLQADLFQAVAKNYSSRFYFPYVRDNPAYAFAKNFRDTFVLGVSNEEIYLDAGTNGTPPVVRFANTSGLRDEAWYVANEIRRLHDNDGVAFTDIAIISRSKDRLGFYVKEALSDRRIPYRSSSLSSLMDMPFAITALDALTSAPPAKDPLPWEEAITHARNVLTDEAREELLKGIDSLIDFADIVPTVGWEEFLRTVSERWSRTDVKDENAADRGVSLLYAEAARGLPFKVVFLIGMEEKEFPRIVREDPFLRDDARIALNGLGHKIGLKLAAFDEERLLFELFIHAASDRLYFVRRRSDEDGAVVGNSPFLRAYAQEKNIDLIKETLSVPRPLVAKLKDFSPAAFGVSDVVAGFLTAKKNQEAAAYAAAVGRDGAGLASGLNLLEGIQRFDAPGAYDGILGPVDLKLLFAFGKISPSKLEQFSKCGFQFFARRVLGLEELDSAEPQEKLDPLLRGELAHKVMLDFFKTVTGEGKKDLPEKFPRDAFEDAFERTFPVGAMPETHLPPLLWSSARAALKISLEQFLRQDFEKLKTEGFRPVFFETTVAGKLPPPLDQWEWSGKIDRIDIKGTEKRVVDYKTGKPMKSAKVLTAVGKGDALQAPLYLLLADAAAFRYSYIEFPDNERILLREDLQQSLPAVSKILADLVQEAAGGRFIIKPEKWKCQHCEMALLCRRNHGISLFRNDREASDD